MEPTDYPGVFFTVVKRTGFGKKDDRKQKEDKSYIIRWKNSITGMGYAERIGRQYRDGMTAAKAARIRAEYIEGKRKTKKQIREERKRAKEAEADRWTLDKIWFEYLKNKTDLKGLVTDKNRYDKHIKSIFGHLMPSEIEESEVDNLKNYLL